MHDRISFYVSLPNWIRERWWQVAYLDPSPFGRERFSEILAAGPDEKFNNFVAEQLKALGEGGTPPAEIAGPILNFADDLAAGRQPVLRAGDYIALRTFMKRGRG